MPLKSGRSQDAISANIGELMAKYERTGKIGKATPASKKKAQQMATAIAYGEANKPKG